MKKYYDLIKKWALIIMFVIGIITVVFPVIRSCGYTYLCEDDFSFEGGARDLIRDYGNIYVGAAHRMAEYYNTNQGTFLFNYIMSALIVYTRGGLPLLHVYMILIFAAFCASLFNLIRLIVRDMRASLGIFLAVCVTLFGMAGTSAGKEIFLWYTGTLNFLVELTLSFIAASLSISYIRSGRMRYAYLGMIFAFFASGGALNVTASNVGWLLAILIMSFPAVKEKKAAIMPFAGGLAGALLNAVAPGNFNRLDNEVAPLHVGLKNTLFCCLSDEKLLLSSMVFYAALILVFFICVVMETDVIKTKAPLVMLAVVLVGTCLLRFFTMFPLAYANGVDNIGDLAMRMRSSYEVVAKLSYVLLVAVFAQWVRGLLAEKTVLLAGAAMALGLLALVFMYPVVTDEIQSSLSHSIASEFKDGTIPESYQARELVIASLELAHDGSDAVVRVPECRLSAAMYGMGLSENSEEFVNRSAAGLFRLNSVSVIYGD